LKINYNLEITKKLSLETGFFCQKWKISPTLSSQIKLFYDLFFSLSSFPLPPKLSTIYKHYTNFVDIFPLFQTGIC